MTAVTASIVVCTRNNASLLRDCIVSILADRSVTPREIVVVDNGSTDDTAAVVAEFATAQDNVAVRHVIEPIVGLSHARNRGVAEARGELVLFTDDDVLAAPGWVDAVAAGFDDPEVGAVGGRIVPDWPVAPPAWLNGPHAELLTLIDYGADHRVFAAGEHPLGANMAVRTTLVRSFDPPFDPRLGHRGDRRMAHEEVHLMNQIRETHVLAYRADAIVAHRVARDRMDLGFMRRTFFELGVGLGRRERLEGAPRLSLPVRIVRAWRTFTGAVRAAKRNDRAPRAGAETWEELYALMWAGKHLEMLFGRFPRFTDGLTSLLVKVP